MNYKLLSWQINNSKLQEHKHLTSTCSTDYKKYIYQSMVLHYCLHMFKSTHEVNEYVLSMCM